MSSGQVTPAVTPADRLGMMLFLGTLLHGLIILGINFSTAQPEPAPRPVLDIILVNNKSPQPPEKADYLAQTNQQGGGTFEEKIKPSRLVKIPSAKPDNSFNKTAPKPTIQKSAMEKTIKKKHITSVKGKDTVLSKPDKTQEKQYRKAEDTRKLINHSLEIAGLTIDIDKKIENYASRPRKKHINANTREFAPAAYMAAWTRKVERIGNLNYPEQARRQNLSGRLQLTVGINKDGSIQEIIMQRKSGYAVLDDAAIRVVKLGAPYARIPDSIQENGEPVDILYITRTWEFTSINTWLNRK